MSPCSLTPSPYELTAVLQLIANEQAAANETGGVAFLIDGSGSVSQGEQTPSRVIAQALAGSSSEKFSFLQMTLMQ